MPKHRAKFISPAYKVIDLIYEGDKIIKHFYQCTRCSIVLMSTSGTNPLLRHIENKKGQCVVSNKNSGEKPPINNGLLPEPAASTSTEHDNETAISNFSSESTAKDDQIRKESLDIRRMDLIKVFASVSEICSQHSVLNEIDFAKIIPTNFNGNNV